MWQCELPESISSESAALRLAQEPGLCWLDGGLSHGHEGRYSFLAAAPIEIKRAFQGELRPLALLDQLGCAPDAVAGGGPLESQDVPRWIGHIAYDAHGYDSARFAHRRERGLPLLWFARYDALYAYDHALGRAFLVGDDQAACARMRERLERPPATPEQLAFRVAELGVTPAERHVAAIGRALAHVRAGDVYQINLARRYRASFSGSALGLFLRMRAESPVPLGYFAQHQGMAVLGRSMERFLRWRAGDRLLWTAPIKGTIARAGQDAAEAEALRADPKEHAEHAMVVDLMRNDLARVAEIGSVEVEELMAVLPFAGLSHLISTLRARARAGLTLGELIEHTFPPGSVTGTPKQRALELIEALEDAPRGIYSGALGFVDRAGGASFAVAIRTAVVDAREHSDADGQVEYFAGGGIVWGSDAGRETAETELKAQVFLRSALAAR